MTFADDIEEHADGPIEAIVIHAKRGGSWEPDPQPQPVLTWDEARPLLDYSYDKGFGLADCHPITAWTANLVIVVAEYDGSTRITTIQRHPTPHVPTFA